MDSNEQSLNSKVLSNFQSELEKIKKKINKDFEKYNDINNKISPPQKIEDLVEEKNLNDENKIQSNSIIDKIKKLSKVNNNLNLITNNNLNNNDNDNSNNNNNFNNSSGGDLIDTFNPLKNKIKNRNIEIEENENSEKETKEEILLETEENKKEKGNDDFIKNLMEKYKKALVNSIEKEEEGTPRIKNNAMNLEDLETENKEDNNFNLNNNNYNKILSDNEKFFERIKSRIENNPKNNYHNFNTENIDNLIQNKINNIENNENSLKQFENNNNFNDNFEKEDRLKQFNVNEHNFEENENSLKNNLEELNDIENNKDNILKKNSYINKIQLSEDTIKEKPLKLNSNLINNTIPLKDDKSITEISTNPTIKKEENMKNYSPTESNKLNTETQNQKNNINISPNIALPIKKIPEQNINQNINNNNNNNLKINNPNIINQNKNNNINYNTNINISPNINNNNNINNNKDNINNINSNINNQNNINNINNINPIISPIKGSNQSILENSILTQQTNLENQMKHIDEISETNRIEFEEKNLLEIKEAETHLQMNERLIHPNKEIRKNALKELIEMCQSDFENEEEKNKVYECFQPWIQYCISENNPYVLSEAMNFFIVFNTIFPQAQNNSLKDFLSNIDRIVSLGIPSINDLTIKIIYLFLKDKKMFNQCISELIRLLNASSMKLLKFISEFFLDCIFNGVLSENYVKMLFEKSIHIYFSMGLKFFEKKKIFSKMILSIYNIIEDDIQTIKNYNKITSQKEFDNLFLKSKKSKDIKFRLYPKSENSENKVIENNEKNNDNEKNYIENNKKNNDIDVPIVSEEVNDIISLLPNSFFEYHFITSFTEKMSILENSNKILNQITSVKEREKNLLEVYKTINYSIEDSNILIHLEGIKLLEHICRLYQDNINEQKLKNLLYTCFDKFKDKKSLVKNELFNLFDMVIENECLQIEQFISFTLQFCINQKKESVIVKQSLLEYLKTLFKYNLKENMNVYIEQIKEKNYLFYCKNIVNIIEKESLSLIKDLSSDLLIIFKGKIKNKKEFNGIINSLPNYRKKIIEKGEESNQSNNSMLNEEKYKKNLKKIKSNYSFNRATSANNRSRQSSSNRKNNKSNNNNNDNSFISNKKKKEELNTSNISSRAISTPKKENIKSKNVLNKKNKQIIEDNNNNNLNIKPIKKTSNTNSTNENSLKENKPKKKSKETMEQHKENLMDNISTMNKDQLGNYSKIIIHDFFGFINKVCSKKVHNEDLSYHFEVIFSILSKILDRIQELLKDENSEKKELKKLNDELIKYISKVIVISPCINQVEGSNQLDISILENFLQKVKSVSNYEKFYLNILLNVYYFSLKEKEFPKELNSKPSMMFFLSYVKDGYYEIKSDKILKFFNEVLNETNVLNYEEKKELYILNEEEEDKKIFDNNKSEITQNMDDPEEPNIGLNNEISKIEHIMETEDKSNIDNNINFNSPERNLNNNYNYRNYIGEDKEDNKVMNENNINNDNNNNLINDNNIITDNNNINEKNNKEDYNDEDPEFLHKKLLEEKELIRQKQEENRILKQKIAEYEQRKNASLNNIKNNSDIKNENSDNKVIIINSPLTNSNSPFNPIIANNSNLTNNLISNPNENKLEEISTEKTSKKKIIETREQIKNNIVNSFKTADDIIKLREGIKQFQKQMDSTINKIRQRTENDKKVFNEILNKSNSQNNLLLNNNIQNVNKNMELSEIQNTQNLNNESLNSASKASTINNALNEMLLNNIEISSYKQYIKQLIKHLQKQNIDEGIYNILQKEFYKLKTQDQKIDYIKYLRAGLDNPLYLNNISINLVLQLFEFIMLILSHEILKNEEIIIVHLQECLKHLKKFRNLNDMFKIMLVLLRKYFPKNLNNKITDVALIMIKLSAYLIKELLKELNESVDAKEILSEINDLFTVTPPSTLTTETPNALFYQNIFKLLRALTDEIVNRNKNKLSSIIVYLQSKIVSEDYIKYLLQLNKNN